MLSKARDGRLVPIDDDVQGVANALHELDSHIRLRYSEAGEHFVIYWAGDPEQAAEEDGESYLIFSAKDLDHRIVHRMREIYHRCQQPGYSFADELEKKDKEAKLRADVEHTERNGEMYERLGHAMRSDLGYDKQRAFIADKATAR